MLMVNALERNSAVSLTAGTRQVGVVRQNHLRRAAE
jgi:hypothetical protein